MGAAPFGVKGAVFDVSLQIVSVLAAAPTRSIDAGKALSPFS